MVMPVSNLVSARSGVISSLFSVSCLERSFFIAISSSLRCCGSFSCRLSMFFVSSSVAPRLVVRAVIISFERFVNISENASVTSAISNREVLQIRLSIFVSRS